MSWGCPRTLGLGVVERYIGEVFKLVPRQATSSTLSTDRPTAIGANSEILGREPMTRIHYRQSWLFSSVFLGLTGGWAVFFTCDAIVRYNAGKMSWDGFVLVIAFWYPVVAFVRTAVFGPVFTGTELHIPRSSRPTTTIAVNDIAGVYLARVSVNAYQQMGWVPVVWTRDQSIIYIRGLTSLRDSGDPGLLFGTHIGKTVTDLYRRVAESQGSAGAISTYSPPLTYGTGITRLLNPRDSESGQHLGVAESAASHIYKPHDNRVLLRGILALLSTACFVAIMVSTLRHPSNSLGFGFSVALGIFTGTIAWRSLRIFTRHSSISPYHLHIRTSLLDAAIDLDQIAGVGLVAVPLKLRPNLCRWEAVVWTTPERMVAIANVASYAKHDVNPKGIVDSRPGAVARDILHRTLVEQGSQGSLAQTLEPPKRGNLRIIRLRPEVSPTATGENA
jgi:hypothetical protein